MQIKVRIQRPKGNKTLNFFQKKRKQGGGGGGAAGWAYLYVEGSSSEAGLFGFVGGTQRLIGPLSCVAGR